MLTLTNDQARQLRMQALLLSEHPLHTPAEVVEWFGAMQAQDVASGHWSFGVRLPGTTDADIGEATANRQIVRTWPMRGTIHFIPPSDARWMLELTGSIALRGAVKRREYLGLTEASIKAAADLLTEALSRDELLTRAQCLQVLAEAGIDSAGQAGYHYLWYISQIGVTVIGPQQGKEQTFALLSTWAPEQNTPTRDEALAILAQRYFRSHGPATRLDFSGWTSLPATDAKAAIASLGEAITAVEVDGLPMYVMTDALAGLDREASTAVTALPGFDEYLLGYKNRSLMASPETMAAVIPGGNGVFRSTIVIDGQVQATWKRSVKANRIDVAVNPLAGWKPTKTQQTQVRQQFEAFGTFVGKPAVVSYD